MNTILNFIKKFNIEAPYLLGEPLSAHCSFKIGGPAECLLQPRTAQELQTIIKAARSADQKYFLLGGGSNVLINDEGIAGLTICTTGLDKIRLKKNDENYFLIAEAGATMNSLCEYAYAQALSGLENFYGLPGSVGGAAYMNARCYENEMSERLYAIASIDPKSEMSYHHLDKKLWDYKKSPYQEGGEFAGHIITEVAFKLHRGEVTQIKKIMDERLNDRTNKGHFKLPCAGSMFKNNRAFGSPTGKILDELGLRGTRRGDALIPEWHANIFCNAGQATARDMHSLIEYAQQRCLENKGYILEPEVIFV